MSICTYIYTYGVYLLVELVSVAPASSRTFAVSSALAGLSKCAAERCNGVHLHTSVCRLVVQGDWKSPMQVRVYVSNQGSLFEEIPSLYGRITVKLL